MILKDININIMLNKFILILQLILFIKHKILIKILILI